VDILRKIKSKPFRSRKNQIERRLFLTDHIADNKYCKMGVCVICFETEPMEPDANLWWYQNGYKPRRTDVEDAKLTIGKKYIILAVNNVKKMIKVENDIGNKKWYSMKRFLYTLKLERAEKLKKLKIL